MERMRSGEGHHGTEVGTGDVAQMAYLDRFHISDYILDGFLE